MSLRKILSIGFALALLASFGAVNLPVAHAASVVVNDAGDTPGPCSTNGVGTCTLRDAITYTNSISGADTITFAANYAISLGGALPTVTDNLSIDGASWTITIDVEKNLYQILKVNPNVTLNLNALTFSNAGCEGYGTTVDGGAVVTNYGTLNVTGSTFSNNNSSNCRGGGAINNAGGSLTVNSSTFSDNLGGFGGAITIGSSATVNGGSATITNSTFKNNNVNQNGGAILNDLSSTLSVNNSQFLSNSADSNGGAIVNRANAVVNSSAFSSNTSGGNISGEGGAIWNDSMGALTVKNSTFTGNSTSTFGDGGGIYNNGGTTTVSNSTFSQSWAQYGGAIYANGGTTSVTRSAFAGNKGWARGGGIYNYTGTSNVTNSTFTTNWTPLGGAIYNDSGTVNVYNSTVSANTGWNQGGGIYNDGTALTLRNTIVSGNSNHDCDDYSNTMTADSHNLDSDGSCAGATTRLVGQIALGPLQNNGGPTQTMALGAGSSALDAGDNAVCAAPPVNGKDQRGLARPQGTSCDVGAFESNTQFGPGFVVNDTEDADDGVCNNLVPGKYNCTLREAINAANARGGSDKITFNIPAATTGCAAANTCTFTLGSSLPAVVSKITLDGSVNNGKVTLHITIANPIITVNRGSTLNVNALTLSNGDGCGNCVNEGGIFNQGTLNVTNSTFTASPTTAGGNSGISNFGKATVTNSTFSAPPNSVLFTGIYNGDGGTLNVTNSTLAGNGAYGLFNSGGTAVLRNTLVANNAGGDCQLAGGTITADTRNLDTDGSCDKATQKTSAELNLGVLKNNGGPTQTIKPGVGSAARDAGRNGVCAAAVGAPDYGAGGHDQRGISRPQGPRCDVGAYEVKVK